MAKHMNIVGSPFLVGELGPGLLAPLNPALYNSILNTSKTS